jgi:4-amino-4-deoxy-L-arabinose transferase-like glycosyltransferase
VRKALLFLILFVGLSLRVIGADWGFPFLLHPDESVVANIPVQMAQRSSLDPGEYNHPDHVDIYANALIYHAASHLVYHKPLTETFASHTLLYYHLSRILVALLGAACIPVAYLIGRHFSPATGLCAALLVALFPSYVEHSHFITSDIPLTLCTLTVILFGIRYLKQPSDGNLLAASFFVAVATSVKYPGVLTALVVAAVVLARDFGNWQPVAKSLAKSLAGFLVSLLLISPFLVLNFGKVVEGVTRNAFPVHLGADGLGWSGNILFYLQSYFAHAGVLATLLFLAGLYLVVTREKLLALPLFFGFIYWIGLSKIGLHWERWALPMYTFPLLVSAYGMGTLLEGVLPLARRLQVPLAGAVAACVVLKLLVASSVVTANFTLTDTRFAAFQFAQQKGITARNSIYEGFTPFSPGSLGYGSILNAYAYARQENKPFRYVVVSSGMYSRYLDEMARYQAESEMYGKVFALPQLARFAAPEYGGEGAPWHLRTGLGQGLAFLLDYARRRESLLTGPTVAIHECAADCFLHQGYVPTAPASRAF